MRLCGFLNAFLLTKKHFEEIYEYSQGRVPSEKAKKARESKGGEREGGGIVVIVHDYDTVR